jgi:hypothetical protein
MYLSQVNFIPDTQDWLVCLRVFKQKKKQMIVSSGLINSSSFHGNFLQLGIEEISST